MSSDKIEVSKDNYIPFIVCLLNIHQYLPKHTFSPAIRIGTNAFRTILGNWNLYRITIDCCSTTEDNILVIVISHYFNKYKSTSNVVIVVFKRLLHTLSYNFETCKMDTCIKLMLSKHPLNTSTIPNIYLIKRNRLNSNNFCNPPQRKRITITQVIHYHSGMTCII